MKNSILILCLLLSVLSCSRKTEINSDAYKLVETDTHLSFPLDDRTIIYTYSLQAFTDADGKEYLVFQHENYREILFYDMQTQQFIKKISCEREGAEAVRRFSGFYVRNMNEIYVTHASHDGISVIDGEGKLIRYFENKTKEGEIIDTYVAVTLLLIREFDSKLYIPLGINWKAGSEVRLQKSNLCATIDLTNGDIHALPLSYFDVLGKEDENMITMNHTTCTNGTNFVYSFNEDENIYVTDLSHTKGRKIKVKSKYLPTVTFQPQKFTSDGSGICEDINKARYLSLIYDPYRNVYYRIAHLKTELENGADCLELMGFGGIAFSVIILNEDFQIIGETRLPDYHYNPRLFFVREDGLYISESHFMNPDFDENKLCFRRLELTKNK